MKKTVILILLCSIFTVGFAGYKLLLALAHPIKYNEQIIESANKFDIDAGIIASVINVESSYRTNAKSNKDAIGLMQIKYSTAEYLIDYYKLDIAITEKDLYDANINIYLGCLYIKYLNNKFNNIWTTLIAYNAGETRVRSWLKDSQYSLDNVTIYNIPFSETKNYIDRIKENLKFYSKVYNK